MQQASEDEERAQEGRAEEYGQSQSQEEEQQEEQNKQEEQEDEDEEEAPGLMRKLSTLIGFTSSADGSSSGESSGGTPRSPMDKSPRRHRDGRGVLRACDACVLVHNRTPSGHPGSMCGEP